METMKPTLSDNCEALEIHRQTTRNLSRWTAAAICQAKRFPRAESGQTVVLIAVSMMVLLLMAGLAVDVAYLYYQKHQMQKAADAGAVGAGMALSIYGAGGQSQIVAAGQTDSGANGFTNNANGITVAVNNPPVDGPYSTVSNSQDYVEVTVSKSQPTFFMKVGGFSSVPVAARSVAGLQGSPACFYILDPTDSDSFLESGGSTSVTLNCGIKVNSSSSTAFEDSGGSCTDAKFIQIVGKYGQCNSISGQPPCTCSGEPGGYAGPTDGAASFTDPLINRTQPTVGTCSNNNPNPSGGVVPSGVYCGGLTLQNGTFIMSGVYIMNGGGFTIQGTTTVTGAGVTVYNTGNSPTYNNYQPIKIQGGNNTVTLSAPTSGPTQGILFWEDRNVPWQNVGQSQTSVISGGANTSLSGTLYFPTTLLTLSGGSSSAPSNLQVVAYKLQLTGGSYVVSNSPALGAPGITTAAMVQ